MCKCKMVSSSEKTGCCTVEFPCSISEFKFPSSDEYTVPYTIYGWAWDLPSNPISTSETKPHKCPVCEGRGIVPPFFYKIGAGSSCSEEICRSCKGLGYIIC